MIERNPNAPTFNGVALVALSTQLTGMDIARAMAAQAIVWQLLRRHSSRVARMAINLCMPAGQLPMSVAGVVERGRLPLLVAVACAAVLTETRGMGILALMTAEAVLGHFVLEVPGAMAVLAVDMRVCAFECETGFLPVVELGGFPAGGGVAVAALRTPLRSVHIVGRVAGHALPGCVLVSVAEMAADARYFSMFVAQRECRLFMVVRDVAPEGGLMARGAIAAQPALVRLLLLVTIEAFRGSFPVWLCGDVTTGAYDGLVCAGQRKFRALVIELIAAQLDDVARAAQVLRMAGAALRGGYAGDLSMKTVPGCDIGSDLLVAIEAQPCLPITVGVIVTLRALLLVFLVSRAQLSRHEKRLRIHGFTAPPGEQSQQQGKEQQRVTFSLPHESAVPAVSRR